MTSVGDIGEQIGQRRAAPGAGKLDQTQLRHAIDIDAGRVVGCRTAQRVQHALTAGFEASAGQVDEIDDHDAADIPQPELPGDLICGVEIGAQDVGPLAAVHINDSQRLRPVDDKAGTAWQGDVTAGQAPDLAFQIVALEQGLRPGVTLDQRGNIGGSVGGPGGQIGKDVGIGDQNSGNWSATLL